VNLTAENQVRPPVNQKGKAAILLYELWGVCSKGARKRRRSEQGYEDETENAGKAPNYETSHDGITSSAVMGRNAER